MRMTTLHGIHLRPAGVNETDHERMDHSSSSSYLSSSSLLSFKGKKRPEEGDDYDCQGVGESEVTDHHILSNKIVIRRTSSPSLPSSSCHNGEVSYLFSRMSGCPDGDDQEQPLSASSPSYPPHQQNRDRSIILIIIINSLIIMKINIIIKSVAEETTHQVWSSFSHSCCWRWPSPRVLPLLQTG